MAPLRAPAAILKTRTATPLFLISFSVSRGALAQTTAAGKCGFKQRARIAGSLQSQMVLWSRAWVGLSEGFPHSKVISDSSVNVKLKGH